MTDYRIGVVGCAGRMGRMLARAVARADGCVLAGGTEQPGHEAVGKDVGVVAGLDPAGVAVIDDSVELFAQTDAVIDFTAPAASVHHAGLAAQAQAVLVIGTTGFDDDDDAKIVRAAAHTPIVKAANMGIGVNLLAAMVRRVAATLDESFDIEVVEMHHRDKVDAPSGTALLLGEAAAAGRGADFDRVKRLTREGRTGERPRGEIGFATLRGGGVVGEHQVVFAGAAERLVLGHIAESRDLFAQGAVRAALWARGRGPGLYSMVDVLGLAE